MTRSRSVSGARPPAGAARPASLAADFGRARVLLMDVLDAPGAFVGDAAARAQALELALGPVAVHVLGAETLEPAAARRTMVAAIGAVQPDVVVVAASAPGGGALARMVRERAAAWWWPTGVGGSVQSWAPWKRRGSSGLAVLPAGDGDAARSYRGAPAPSSAAARALDWAACELPARTLAKLPLWDGRYVVAPVPLGNGAGTSLLEAFAALDPRWDRVELVVLGDVQPECQRRARALGIGARVHFAGPATAEAEVLWLSAAAGVMLAHRGPVAGGLVLRALACGAPVVAFGENAPVVHGWLADRGALPESWASPGLSGRTKLEHLLERDRAVERAVARGREIAAHHAADQVGLRLRAALEGERHRRAA